MIVRYYYIQYLSGGVMRRSTKQEMRKAKELVFSTRARIQELLQNGKKVHIIWDFDGVLADSRSEDILTLTGFDLKAYFAHEERLLFQSPDPGLWLLPIAHNAGIAPHFPQERFTQDIVTALSSTLSIRVHMFCLSWNLSTRWMLFLGHQPKRESYRIILESLKDDPDYHVFCIDDNAKHIETFQTVCDELDMKNRTAGIVAPTIRTYSKKELREYFNRVMSAAGDAPLRVRDPSDDAHGFCVLPHGLQQFREHMNTITSKQIDISHHTELRNTFVKTFGEIGSGRFQTEDELEHAMQEFIIGLHCP